MSDDPDEVLEQRLTSLVGNDCCSHVAQDVGTRRLNGIEVARGKEGGRMKGGLLTLGRSAQINPSLPTNDAIFLHLNVYFYVSNLKRRLTEFRKAPSFHAD